MIVGPTIRHACSVVRLALILFAGGALAQAPIPEKGTFEGQPAFILANDKLSLSIWERGGAIVDLVFKDDPEKISPLWNPIRLARELGQTRAFGKTRGSQPLRTSLLHERLRSHLRCTYRHEIHYWSDL